MATKEELYQKGAQLKGSRDFEGALAQFREAIQLDPNYTLPMHAAVQCLTELGRHDEAIAMGKQIIHLEPDDYFSYIALSRAYQRAGLIPEAEYAMMQGQQAQMRSQTCRS